ncbi:hypothetical protein VNI00_001685 [Paramarasmius palmivorus]|uniref:Uncharacterized protein n=1 Tax=Paramarasmius palmivorus TaxID=297713 RepID=A0AAW0E4R5_9AGAR
MSTLPRSKSAPQPLPALRSFTNGDNPRPELPRSASHQVIQPKSKSYYHATKAELHRPVISPRVERRDPFNAAGFFPASFGEIESGDESSWWLREEDEDANAGRSHSRWTSAIEEHGNVGNGVNGQISDEMTRETIKNADTMGILSIENFFAADDEDRYQHLLSPYSDDQPVDHESLYLSLCARRKAQGIESADNGKTFGELFLSS